MAQTSSENSKKLTLNLPKGQKANYYIIQEDISKGERIRAYRIEAQINGKWKTVSEGTSVGHKRIASFPETEARKFRLVVDECTATPVIRNFSVYQVAL